MSVKINTLSISPIGLFEFLIAMMPILSSYYIGKFYFHLFVPIILILLSIKGGKEATFKNKYLLYFCTFLIIHEIVWLIVLPTVLSYFINTLISFIIIAVSIYFIPGKVDFTKLKNSLNVVAIVSILGMFYQAIAIKSSGTVNPLPIPFLIDITDSTSRLFEYQDRPVSFYPEPQAYVSFMIFPLFFALIEKKMIWAGLIVLSILMSGSTTGIAVVGIMLAVFALAGKNNVWIRLLVLLGLGGSMFFLKNSSFTEVGVEKLQSTDYQENIRLVNGVFIALTMNISDYLFGVPFANATDYYMYSRRSLTGVIPDGEGVVFVPAFWACLIKCGLFGLFLYIKSFFSFLKEARSLLPLWGCLFVSLFTNPDFFGTGFLFQMIVIISYISYKQNLKPNKQI